MVDATTLTGHCLCRAVTVTAKPSQHHLDACHCTMCRRWGSGPLMVVECADNMTVEGAAHITTYASSAWAERAFCGRCGTHLYYRLKEGGFLAVSAGLFPLDESWSLAHEVFIDEKPGYYALAGNRERLTGEELFARYGAS